MHRTVHLSLPTHDAVRLPARSTAHSPVWKPLVHSPVAVPNSAKVIPEMWLSAPPGPGEQVSSMLLSSLPVAMQVGSYISGPSIYSYTIHTSCRKIYGNRTRLCGSKKIQA